MYGVKKHCQNMCVKCQWTLCIHYVDYPLINYFNFPNGCYGSNLVIIMDVAEYLCSTLLLLIIKYSIQVIFFPPLDVFQRSTDCRQYMGTD